MQNENPASVDASMLMAKEQAAAYVGLSEAYLLRLARKRLIRSYRIGKFVKFQKSDLDEYAASCVQK
jgi:excisionase family DNA binding protein